MLRLHDEGQHKYIDALMDLAVRKFRRMIIEVFGLYLRRTGAPNTIDDPTAGEKPVASPDAGRDFEDCFVPGAMLFGNPERMWETQKLIDTVLMPEETVEVDAFADALKSATMDPVIEEVIAATEAKYDEQLEDTLLELAGVFTTDQSPAELRAALQAARRQAKE